MIAATPMSVATRGTTNSFFEILAKYPQDQRTQYIALLRPFLTTDAGIAAGIDNVNSGMFEVR